MALTCPPMFTAHSIASVRTGAAQANQAVTYNTKNSELGVIKSSNLSGNMKT